MLICYDINFTPPPQKKEEEEMMFVHECII